MAEITSGGTAPRRSRWPRRLAMTAAVILLLLTFGGWLQGQEQWGPFRGQIVDAETGAPIPNANVMVTWDAYVPNFADTVSRFYDARETVTDSQGRFEIPRLWRLWTINVKEPGVGYFAPGYVPVQAEVTPADGDPFIDPTVVKMRPLKTREERCLPSNRAGAPLHDKAPRYRAAVYEYDRELRCYERESSQ
jgi:hypothetical protein